MGKIWAFGTAVFVIIILLFWRFTKSYFKNESRLVYWQVSIYTSVGITVLGLFLLKWAKIITF